MKRFVKAAMTCLLGISLLGQSNTFAQQRSSLSESAPGTLGLEELLEQALENNPEIKSMQRRFDVMRARVPQATALDGPMLSVGYMGNIAPAVYCHRKRLTMCRLYSPPRNYYSGPANDGSLSLPL